MTLVRATTAQRRGALASAAGESGSFAFVMLCIFIVSYFLRLTQRLPFLGVARFDAVIAAVTLAAILFGAKSRDDSRAGAGGEVGKRLLILLGYVVLTIPFVQWPGSVLSKGLEPFLKAMSFYYFVVATVDSVGKLKTVVGLYVGCQMFRILEPLYMHLTTGYWGSFAMGANWTLMDRLAGSPYDIINPNGLGFIVVTTLPLLHYFCPPTTAIRKLLYASMLLAAMYTLMLTGSRSAFLALIVMMLIVIVRSKRRALLLGVATVIAIVGISMMDSMQRDRYMSIYSHDTLSSGTAEGRLDGVMADLRVAAQRPLFGFGVGNSREANANFRGEDKLSHDLYTEVAQELGFVGLAIFLSVLVAMVSNCYRVKRAVAEADDNADALFLRRFCESLLVLILVYLFFSFASYGLSEPYWYYIGGLSSATIWLAGRTSKTRAPPAPT